MCSVCVCQSLAFFLERLLRIVDWNVIHFQILLVFMLVTTIQIAKAKGGALVIY